MAGSKNAKKSSEQGITDSEASALLGVLDDTVNFDWDGLNSLSVRELVSWVARCSGLCTMGCSSDGSSIYCSIRFGSAYKSYTFPDPTQFEHWAGSQVERCKLAWRDKQKAKADETLSDKQ